MDESILTSVKKSLGIVEEYEHFDPVIITHINSVFSILTQLGVGPSEGFVIRDKTSLWIDFLLDRTAIEFVKTYTCLKVRLIFDPPTNSSMLESMTRLTQELEWRIQITETIA